MGKLKIKDDEVEEIIISTKQLPKLEYYFAMWYFFRVEGHKVRIRAVSNKAQKEIKKFLKIK